MSVESWELAVHLQVTFVAFSIPRCELQSSAGARRRVQVLIEQPDVTSTQGTCRRYKGVRFRADRKSWVAEMKPFKYKNKVSFGDFKSAMEAARAVDVAFFYYDKSKWRNFRDSPAFLPPLPGPLSEEGKLKFVKEQARSLAFLALRLPSTWDPSNRCEEYKPASPPSSGKVEVLEAASDSQPNDGDREKTLSMSAEAIDVDEITTTSETLICNHDSSDRFEEIQEELVSQEALNHSVKELEAMIRSDGSQATASVRPEAIAGAQFQPAPVFLDDDELWNQIRANDPPSCEELKALDVNDYIEMLPMLEVEDNPVHEGIL